MQNEKPSWSRKLRAQRRKEGKTESNGHMMNMREDGPDRIILVLFYDVQISLLGFVRHDLEQNILPSSSNTQSISA